MSQPTTMYRYEERRYAPSLDERDNPIPGSGRTEIILMEFKVIRSTPKGVWIGDWGDRFVLLSARKRYACPTIEEALESFLARKRRQARILEKQLEGVRSLIYMAEHGGAPRPANLPGDSSEPTRNTSQQLHPQQL